MSEHTPGPWKLQGGVIVNGSMEESPYSQRYPVICRTDNPRLQVAEQNANARRIVDCVNSCEGINPEAVPELLEACKAVVGRVDIPRTDADGVTWCRIHADLVDRLRAAFLDALAKTPPDQPPA